MVTIRDERLEPFILEIDGLNYSLMKEVTIKSGKSEGKINKEAMGYYTSLDAVIHAVVLDKTTSEDRTMDLKKFMTEWNKNQEKFSKLFKTIIKGGKS